MTALMVPRCARCGNPGWRLCVRCELALKGWRHNRHPARQHAGLELDDGDSDATWRERDRRWMEEYAADHPSQEHFTV